MSHLQRDRARLLRPAPSLAQRRYLQKGMKHRWGRLPLFDEDGQRYSERTISSCVNAGWIKPAYDKTFLKGAPMFRLTEYGRQVVASLPEGRVIPFKSR